jgi:undecaprenyl-diphosphatase
MQVKPRLADLSLFAEALCFECRGNVVRRQTEERLIDRWVDFEALFARLDTHELPSVRRHAKRMDFGLLRGVVLVITRLSNGILYPVVAVAVLGMCGRPIIPAVMLAMSTIMLAHLCYPIIKSYFGRLRPFDRDPSIPSLLKPLDRYSFPSGHVMTATAAFLPLSGAEPAFLPIAALAVWLIGWARLSAGHHYPSDVIGGILLGSLFGGPGMALFLY